MTGLAVPLVTALVLLPHPPDPRRAADLEDQWALYLGIHVALLVLVPCLAVVVWWLLDGIDNRPARLSRAALPFAVALYAAFDALVGIGAGVLARESLAMPGSEAAGAAALAERWMAVPMPLPLITTAATATWALAVGAAAWAHRRAGSHPLTVGGLAVAAPLFAWHHPRLPGAMAMLGLLVAVMFVGWLRPSGPAQKGGR